MDFNSLAEQLGLDEEDYMELIEIFIDSGKSDLKKFINAMSGNEITQMANIAHSIKGSSANLGLSDIADIAKNIEQKIKQGHIDDINQNIQDISNKIDEISSIHESKSQYS